MCEDVSGGVDSALVEAEIDLDFAPEDKRNSTIIKKVSFLGIFVIKTGRACGDKWKVMKRFATLYNWGGVSRSETDLGWRVRGRLLHKWTLKSCHQKSNITSPVPTWGQWFLFLSSWETPPFRDIVENCFSSRPFAFSMSMMRSRSCATCDKKLASCPCWCLIRILHVIDTYRSRAPDGNLLATFHDLATLVVF